MVTRGDDRRPYHREVLRRCIDDSPFPSLPFCVILGGTREEPPAEWRFCDDLPMTFSPRDSNCPAVKGECPIGLSNCVRPQ